MIFLGDLIKIIDGKYQVGLIHNMPFDPVQGFNKPREELEKTGILIEALPDVQEQEGKSAVLYANPATKDVWWEYVIVSPTSEERISALEDAFLALLDI